MKTLRLKLIDKGICEFYIEDELVFKKKLPIDTWSLEDFQKQWEEGLQRIKNNNKSILAIWVSKLNKNPDIVYYSLYRIDNKIHIQEWRIIGKENYEYLYKIHGPFTPENCYEYIFPYKKKYTDYIIDI